LNDPGAVDTSPGTTFAGRFLVDAFVGQGAMGFVYRVTDRANGATCALKVMNVDLKAEPDFERRFLVEAKIGASIPSPHVVRVLDSGVDAATALPWFSMELLEGEDLHRLLEHAELDEATAKLLLRQLFATMSAAHAANVVHRDLKPENLFAVKGAPGDPPTLKVLDFGVAKVFRETTTVGGTRAGLGSPLWVAPEQGKQGQTIRPPADVWALGLITYRLLAGKVYWLGAREGTSAFDLAIEMLRAPLVAPSARSAEIGARDLGPAFDRWFLRAVNRDPLQRFPDAASGFEALEPILTGTSPSAPEASDRTTLAIARRLAAAQSSSKLPCPGCGASLRADNLEKHLDKFHAGLQSSGATSWGGADGRALRPLLVVMILWTIPWVVLLAVLPDTFFRIPLLGLLTGLVVVGALLALFYLEHLPARLTLAEDELTVRYFFGLLGRRVRVPAAIEVGRAFRTRPASSAIHDPVTEPGVEEKAGSYLRLAQGDADVIVRCVHDCMLEQHWLSPGTTRGPRRDRWDISLDRSSFAALEYALADRGLFTLRAG
jgi:serine/threonine protein kinase